MAVGDRIEAAGIEGCAGHRALIDSPLGGSHRLPRCQAQGPSTVSLERLAMV
jgi:hypothetical protein